MQSLADIPSWMASAWGINETAAQLILSVTVILAFILPVLYMRHDRGGAVIELVMLFIAECLCVGLGWLSIWILVATIGVMAMSIAFFGSKVITGE